MARTLPTAEVVRNYIDDYYDARTPVLVLDWQEAPGQAEQVWELPEGMCVVGPPPRRLGVHIRRLERDAYAVRLVWDNTQLNWPILSRLALLASCLTPLLASLGVDLWSLLEQPVPSVRCGRRRRDWGGG